MILLLGLLISGQPSASNAAYEFLHRSLLHKFIPYGPLDGTIWTTAANHKRLQIDHPWKITHEEDTEIYIFFLSYLEFQKPFESGYNIKVDQLSKSGNSNANKSATLVSNGEKSFIYTEHSSRPLSDFSGKKGHGIFRIIDKDTAELTEVRRLAGGSASTLIVKFHRMDINLNNFAPRTSPPAR